MKTAEGSFVYSQEVVLRLAGRIYAAAGDASLWAEFLEDLAGLLRAGPANLLAYDVEQQDAGISASVGTDSGIIRRYAEHFAPLDPWFKAGGQFIATGGVFAGQMVIPDSEYEKTEFYQDFMRPQRIFHQVAAVIEASPGRVAVISALRARTHGTYGEGELQLFGALLPHFRQALRLHRQFVGLQHAVNSLEDILDRLPIGVVLADAKGRSVHHNRCAARRTGVATLRSQRRHSKTNRSASGADRGGGAAPLGEFAECRRNDAHRKALLEASLLYLGHTSTAGESPDLCRPESHRNLHHRSGTETRSAAARAVGAVRL